MTRSDAPNAVILAAGLGTRLRPLTLERPKPLIEVHGTPILRNALQNLVSLGVRNVTIVVGYQADTIERFCQSAFPGLHIEYVRSSVFDRTGSAYSLWLARESLLKGDTLILEGDVFFERVLLNRLVASRYPDVAAVAPFTELLSGSAVTLTEGGFVKRILMNQTTADQNGTQLFKTVNLYRFSANTLSEHVVPALESAVAAGECRWYIEQVLTRLVDSGALELNTAICGDLNWFEIDSTEDLRIAESIFAPPAPLDTWSLQPAV
jgi:choline kinase